MVELLNANCRYREENGVYIDAHWVPAGVTEQFLSEANTYHQKYYNNDYWTYLVDRGLTAAKVDRSKNLTVLDIGSGSGNSFFAAQNLLSHAQVVASDISPQLLKLLVQVSKKEGGRKVSAYCFDLHKDFFSENSFDLIIGGAIFHHLLDPREALINIAKWAKKDSPIILFEPMQCGGYILSAVYQTLLDELSSDCDPRLLNVFRAMINDYEHRFGVPHLKPWTSSLDDKWLFTRNYFDKISIELGLFVELIKPLTDNC